MPIPKPRKDEKKDEFITRCMSDNVMVDEYPNNKQRMAICNQSWKDRNKELAMDTIYKYFVMDKGEFDENDFTVIATASKEVIDRDGDLIKVDGIDLRNWKKNPVIMLFHNYHDFPVGIGVGKKAWVDGKKLMIKFKFLIDDNEKAYQAARLWKAGALRGLSIGFKADFNSIEYPDKKAKGIPNRIFKSVELLEVSIVPIPSNQDALMASVNKSLNNGNIDMEDFNIIKDIIDEYPTEEFNEDNFTPEEKIAELENRIKELELELQAKDLESLNEEEEDIYEAIYKEYGLETKEEKLNRLLEEL